MQAMFRSAVFKLTAIYVTIVMSICVTFSGILYHLAVTELQTGIYNQYSRWLDAYAPFGLRTPSSPDRELSSRAKHIFSQLVYLNLAVLILTTIASYVLAKRTLRPIEAAHDQQKRFTADVSHELRTPLTAIKMESEVTLLDKKASARDLQASLRSNLEEVAHMETLINNLLLLSSLEANKLRTEFTRLDLQELILDAKRAVSRLSAHKHITIDHSSPQFQVRGDKSTLTQLLIILLENAIKYSPDNSTVVVRASRGRGRAVIDIHDKGRGISADALPHIFDRFYRADDSRDRKEGSASGFGLGLSLAKLIVDLHDGEIIISSSPGSGTRARIILPQ